MSFKNEVVIVTGASSGIGAAVAEAFSIEGAKVVIVGRNDTKLNMVAARCNKPLVILADLAKDEDVKLIIDKTIEKYGKLNILIHNAAICVGGSLVGGNVVKALDSNFRVNLRAVVYLTTLATPHIIKAKGNIINISSVAATVIPVDPICLTYHISKAALNHFTTCAAAELAPFGVRVNAISPGPVITDFLDNNSDIKGSWDEFKKLTALKRVSDAKGIADLVLFLASDRAKAITGSNFVSDNGYSIKNV